jgi:hypothetical protein
MLWIGPPSRRAEATTHRLDEQETGVVRKLPSAWCMITALVGLVAGPADGPAPFTERVRGGRLPPTPPVKGSNHSKRPIVNYTSRRELHERSSRPSCCCRPRSR